MMSDRTLPCILPQPNRYNDLIKVGTRCRAKRKTGVCGQGEKGVCYEVWSRNNSEDGDALGFSFIFESGRYDGFSGRDIDLFLIIEPIVVPQIANYQFTNVRRLSADFDRRVFDAAWPK